MKCELCKEIYGNKVTKMKCKVCIKREQNIIGEKNVSKTWINGTTLLKKHSLEKHVKGDPHFHVANLDEKQKLGAYTYNQEVVSF